MRTTSRRPRFMGFGLALALSVGLVGIGSGPTASAWTDRSTPIITSVAPRLLTPGKDSQTVSVTGQDFQPRLVLMVRTPEGGSLEYKGDAILAQRESSFQVVIAVPTPGKYSFVVTNADGGTSDPFVLEARVETKPPLPVVARVLPEEIVKSPEPQNLTIEGKNFGPDLRVIVTDPLGVEVLDPVVRQVTTTSFQVNVKLETAGSYNLVVSNATGAVSNVATIVVK